VSNPVVFSSAKLQLLVHPAEDLLQPQNIEQKYKDRKSYKVIKLETLQNISKYIWEKKILKKNFINLHCLQISVAPMEAVGIGI